MNKVALCGNLGRDWDISNHEFGLMARNVLAVSSNFKKDKEQKTDWIPIVCFASKADVITKYTQKGDKILIADGSISVSNYTDEAGNPRTSFNVVINDFEFLPNGRRNDNNSLTYQAQTMQNYAGANNNQPATQDYSQAQVSQMSNEKQANNDNQIDHHSHILHNAVSEPISQAVNEGIANGGLNNPAEQSLFNNGGNKKANNDL